MLDLTRAIPFCLAGVLLAQATPVRAADADLSTDRIVALIDAAKPGATITVPPGTYHGNLRVTKSVILDGAGAATIDAGGKGTVVHLLAPNITFRGFTIRASGSTVDREPAGIRAETGPVFVEHNHLEDVLFGIDLRSSPGSTVSDNTLIGKPLELARRGDGIRLWWSKDCTVERNAVKDMRDMVFWYSEDLRIRDNHVQGCRYGLHFMYSHDTTIARNTLRANSVGVYLMYSNRLHLEGNTLTENRGASGYGIGLKDCDDVTVTRNHLLSNRVGVYIDNAPSSVDAYAVFSRNRIAFNEIGMLITPNTKHDRIVENGFIENEEQVGVHGRGTLAGNDFTTAGRGNFWSDYAGFDRDHDAIGDLPYKPNSLFESLLASEPNLRLFVHSPAQQAVEFTARALPTVQPEPKLTDSAPLMNPPELPMPVQPPSMRRAMLGAALALLAIGSAIALAAARGARFPAPAKGALA